MRALLILAATGLISCVTPAVKEADTSAWEAFGYKGLAGEINHVAGEGSLNCGIHNYLDSNDPVNRYMSMADSRACIKKAIKTQTPFRYGSVRIPVDSYLFDALVLSNTSQYWIIKYDAMLDGSGVQRFISHCESVKIDYDTLQYKGITCKSVDVAKWQETLNQRRE